VLRIGKLFIIYLVESLMKKRNLFSNSSLEMHFEKRKFFFNIKNLKFISRKKKKKKTQKLTIITHNY